MKIAFVHHTFIEGSGIETVISELAKRLSEKHEVAIFTFNNECPQNNLIKEVTIPFKQNRISNAVLSPIYIYRIGDMRKLLSEYDVINTHLYPANLIPLLPTKLKKPLHVVTEWGTQSPQAFNTYTEKAYLRLLLKANNYADRHADIVIAGNRETQYELLQHGINVHRMYLYGIDFKQLDKVVVSPESIYKRYPELRGNKVILYIGRHSPHKNIDILIKSLKIVKRGIPNTKLVLVGRHSFPTYIEQLRDIIRSEGLEDDVILTGFVPQEDIAEYYAVCDIFTVCSAWEGYLIPEPLGMAKPMVGYDAIPHRETIRNYENGLLVNELTPEAFAKAQVTLLSNDNLRQSMGEAGYKWARANLDYDIIANNFTCFLEGRIRGVL